MSVLQVIRRLLGRPSDGWPSRTPPTVAAPAPHFYCARCRRPVPAQAAKCPACESPTWG